MRCFSKNAKCFYEMIHTHTHVHGYARYDCDCVQGEGGGACSNCGVACTVTHVTPKGALCNSCYQHWRYVERSSEDAVLFMSG